MTLIELLEKCNHLPYSDNETLKTSLIDAIMFPIKLGDGDWDWGGLQSVFKHKVIFSHTQNDEKYGQRLSILYLNDEPMLLFSQYGKWLDSYSSYHFSVEKLEMVRNELTRLFVPSDGMDVLSSTLLTDDTIDIASYFDGTLDGPQFPYINDNAGK